MSTGPTLRRPIKYTSSTEEQQERVHDTESPPSPTAATATTTTKLSHMGKTGRKAKPLNVYKAGTERQGASLRIILFVLVTTCYTAFLYSGAATSTLNHINHRE